MSEEIKTCPECEALPKIIPYFFGEYGAHDVRYYAQCPICKKITFSYSKPELAVLEWNKNCEARKRRMDRDDVFAIPIEQANADVKSMINKIVEKEENSHLFLNQEIKADAGKWRLSLVPTQIIKDIAEVREYGVKKYGDSESWRQVELDRYTDALGRHFIEFLKEPLSKDDESGLEHYKHMACNMAFICELLNVPF